MDPYSVSNLKDKNSLIGELAVDSAPIKDDLVFKEGSAAKLMAFVDSEIQKLQSITKTLVPLVETALLKLLGNSTRYSRQSADVVIGKNSIAVTLVYLIPAWIHPEAKKEDVEHDAKEVYDTISTFHVQSFQKCELDPTKGTLTIQCTL